MTKVIWNENYIEYFYSKREPYWLKDYFKLIIFNENTKRNFEEKINSFEVVDDKKLIIDGNFKIGTILEVDGIQYVCDAFRKDVETQTETTLTSESTQTEESEKEDIKAVDKIDLSTQTDNETTDVAVGSDEIIPNVNEASTQTDVEEKTSEDENKQHSFIGLNDEGKMLLGDDEVLETNDLINTQAQSNETGEKPKKEIKHSDKYFELMKLEGTDFSNIKIVTEESNLFIVKSTNEAKHIKMIVEEYTREIYPEFPYNIVKKQITIKNDYTLIYSVKKGTIIILKLTDELGNEIKIECENTPLFHYSTVNSLKETIKDFNLELREKDDEFYKSLISQKSLYLKQRFGLTQKQTSNIEFFPLYKQLVDLYCILSMVSFSFIQGKPLMGEDGKLYHNSELKLGKFKTDGDFDTGSLFGPDAIRKSIKQAEEDLSKALINDAYIINHYKQITDESNYHNPFICGVYLKQKILSNICHFNTQLKIKDIE